jgi:hypothetical protein
VPVLYSAVFQACEIFVFIGLSEHVQVFMGGDLLQVAIGRLSQARLQRSSSP